MKNAILTMELADLAVRIASGDGVFIGEAATRFGPAPEAAAPALDIELTTAGEVNRGKGLEVASGGDGSLRFGMRGADCVVDFARGKAELLIVPDATALEYIMKVLFSALLLRNGGGLFHAAGVARSGKGYLFAGPPGAGKSTVAAIAGAGRAALHDELVAVRMLGDGLYRLFAPPGWAAGSAAAATGTEPPVPLAACFILSHGKDGTSFRTGTPAEEAGWLFDNICYVLPEKGVIESAIGLAADLQRKVRTAKLEFDLRDREDFWNVIGRHLGEEV